MEVRELKTLLVLMRDYGLVELEIEDKKGKVRLVRGGGRASVDVTESGSDAHLAARAASPIKMATRHVEATAEEGGEAAGEIDLAPNQKLIESPMVGTFYRAASPDAAPFVEEGIVGAQGPAAVHHRGDEDDERDRIAGGRPRDKNSRRERAAGRIRTAPDDHRSDLRGRALAMFKKLLVANRGTIAIRIIRACRELGISTVAVYSTADKDALHVRMADESVCIGPPAAEDSYLNIPSILSAATTFGADAVHPGYGFLSENGDFAEACQRSGLNFVGPRARHIRLMGDKPRARRIMKRAGVPVLPGSEGKGVTGVARRAGRREAARLPGTDQGGGRRRRQGDAHRARRRPSWRGCFRSRRRESEASFGSRKMYLEKYLEHARHVEFQILADTERNAIHLGERDCSIQRRHQKVIEESPCPVLTARLRDKMGKAAVRAAEVVGYSNVGTVEFLLAASGEFYFIEMNTRIQVEHGVTEMVTGVDLVKESIRMAMGEPLGLKQRQVTFDGAAMEFRIYAEDPDRHMPAPGVVTNHHPPGGLGVRVETALYDGYRVPVQYDPLIAKLIVHADTRAEVIARAKAALREYVIDGIKTNIPLHLKILHDPDFNRGQFSTDFLSRYEPAHPEAAHHAPVSKAS